MQKFFGFDSTIGVGRNFGFKAGAVLPLLEKPVITSIDKDVIMAGVRIEFAQFGSFDSFSIYRSNTPMNVNNLPAPIATGLATMYYVDDTVVEGLTYHYRVSVARGSDTMLSDEVEYTIPSANNNYDPLPLFTATQTGVIYDPSDLSTLFKDDAGLEPVTADNDIVRLMKDKSGSNNHARIGIPLITETGTSIVSGMRYRTNGTIHWLEPIDKDSGFVANAIIKNGNFSSFFALKYNDLSDDESQYFSQGEAGTRIKLYSSRITSSARGLVIFDNKTVVSNGVLDTNPHVYSVIHNNSTKLLVTQADNLSEINHSGMANTAPQKPVDLFRRVSSYQGRFYGAIIVSNLVATTEDRNNIKNYLASKSGIII